MTTVDNYQRYNRLSNIWSLGLGLFWNSKHHPYSFSNYEQLECETKSASFWAIPLTSSSNILQKARYVLYKD